MDALQLFYFNYQLEVHLFAILALISVCGAVVYSSKIKRKSDDVNNLFSQIVTEATEQDNIIAKNNEIEKQSFQSAFPEMLNSIADDVNGVSTPEDTSVVQNQTIWVNWMLNIAGKVRLKESTITIRGAWGTKSSVAQLKAALDEESKQIVNGKEFSWSVQLISPLTD